MSKFKPFLLAVVIRDIARAQHEGRCTREYLDDAAGFIADALGETEHDASLLKELDAEPDKPAAQRVAPIGIGVRRREVD